MPGDGIQGAAWINTAQTMAEDIDSTYTFNPDGTLAQIVMTGSGRTKTMVFTWVGGVLQSIATVIT